MNDINFKNYNPRKLCENKRHILKGPPTTLETDLE